jgi:hypothetical protein
MKMTIAADAQIEAMRCELEQKLRKAQHGFSYPHAHGLIKVKRVGSVGNERFICYTENDEDERNTFVEIELRTGHLLNFAKYNTFYFTRRVVEEILGGAD